MGILAPESDVGEVSPKVDDADQIMAGNGNR